MEASAQCPFRYIWKGRTFCAISIRERKYTTSEVVPTACAQCKARGLIQDIGCRHLNLGVEVDQYGGSHDVNIFYASCEKLMERIMDFGQCGKEKCPHWQPLDEDQIAAVRAEALAAHREAETSATE